MQESTLFKSTKFYPPWRKPLVKPSIAGAKYLVAHGFQHPLYLSYAMIVVGFIGGTLFFFQDIWLNFIGWILIYFSYFLDMMDGKTSKLLNKPYKGVVGFLDNNFHIPLTSYVLFLIGLRLSLETGSIYGVLFGFIASFIFLWKTMMQFSFEVHNLEVHPVSDTASYEDQMSYQTYHTMMYDTSGVKHVAYIGVRPFLDATDILIFLFFAILLGLEGLFLFIVLVLHCVLFAFKLSDRIKQLTPDRDIYIENWKRTQTKKKYDELPLDKNQEYADLKEVGEILKKHNIKCWLYGGNLLGVIRDGDFIAGDRDIDLVFNGSATEFKKAEADLKAKGWILDIYYNHVKIVQKKDKIDISIYEDRGDYYVEDVLKINFIGRWCDALMWLFKYPPEQKYETSLPLRLLYFIGLLKYVPLSYRIVQTLYSKFGYFTTEFFVKKEYVDPIRSMDFKGIEVYVPSQPEKIFELFYGTEWKTPSEDYIGRTLHIVPNKVISFD
jgi:phosphorylcholine metabolism protein LicD